MLETSIVSTSLVSITNDLDGFGQSSWLITVYLINYAGCLPENPLTILALSGLTVTIGFMIIFAKMSDLVGRKLMMLIGILIFGLFSGACGAAQSMVQLWVTPSNVKLLPQTFR